MQPTPMLSSPAGKRCADVRCRTNLHTRASILNKHQHHQQRPQVVVVAKNLALSSLALVLSAASAVAPLPAASAGWFSTNAAVEKQLQIEQQKQRLEYLIEQQYIALQAKVQAERAQLEQEKAKAEAAIEQQVNKEQAVLEAALAQQDDEASKAEVQAAEAALAKLEKAQSAVEAAAAQVGAVIEREEILAAAQKEEALQKLEAEVEEASAPFSKTVNALLEPFLEAVTADSSGETTSIPEAASEQPAAADILAEAAAAADMPDVTTADVMPVGKPAAVVAPDAAEAAVQEQHAAGTDSPAPAPVPVFEMPVARDAIPQAALVQVEGTGVDAPKLEVVAVAAGGEGQGPVEVAEVASGEGSFSVVVDDPPPAVDEETDEEAAARQAYCEALEQHPEYGLDCMNCEC